MLAPLPLRSDIDTTACPRAPAWAASLALGRGALLLGLLCLSAKVQAQETVFAAFDLAGWHRLGLVSGLVDGQPAALEPIFDRRAGTGQRHPAGEPLRLVLEFEQGQQVRNVHITPGPQGVYAVRLVVVKVDGSRFAAGEFVVDEGRLAIFRLLDVACRRFEIEIESVSIQNPGANPERDPVMLAEVVITGRLSIVAISLEDVPAALPEGGSFPVRVMGRDSFGGRPELTAVAQLAVTPARALALVRRGNRDRAVTRVGGTMTIAPHLGALKGSPQVCIVQPLMPAPPPPSARPGMGLVEVSLAGEPPFQVLRRAVGVIDAVDVGRTEDHDFVDDTVEAGQAYQYSARRIDRFDNPLSERSKETRVRTLPPGAAHMRVDGRVPLLLAVFTDSLADGERERIAASLEAARLFLWRHTRGRLMLDPTWLDIPGKTPVTAGPTMAGIESRLRSLGVRPHQYGVVFAVANDLDGSYGGFRLLGGTAGAMGRDADTPTPPLALGPDPGQAFAFVHEFWHVVSLNMSAAAQLPPQPTAYFADDLSAQLLGKAVGRPFDAGESWDGHAALYAGFDAWEQIPAPFRRHFEVLDTDGDGLPDDAPRWPLDELRLGTDPTVADTDADGLSDLEELAAGLYIGSNPLDPDTDGDGLLDGHDPWPLTNFTGRIAHGEQPQRLASIPSPARLRAEPIRLAACWNERGLTLEITTQAPRDVFIDLDGSGRLGRWESDFDTGQPGAPASDVWCGPARLALRAHAEPRGVFVGNRAIPGASLKTERVGDQVVIRVVLPVALGPGAPDARLQPGAGRGPGLRLTAGQVLGLAITVRPTQADDQRPFEPFIVDELGRPLWTSLFETHRLLDATLQPVP